MICFVRVKLSFTDHLQKVFARCSNLLVELSFPKGCWIFQLRFLSFLTYKLYLRPVSRATKTVSRNQNCDLPFKSLTSASWEKGNGESVIEQKVTVPKIGSVEFDLSIFRIFRILHSFQFLSNEVWSEER